jgi:DNA-binding transcriptional ArsR family regulator
VSSRYGGGVPHPSSFDWSVDDPQALADATRNVVRGRVLMALAERPGVTIRQVAERIDESPRRVRHHIESLVEAGLAEVTGEESRRGVVQRRYGAPPQAVDRVDALSDEDRAEFTRSIVRYVLSDIGTAAAAGTLALTEDKHVVRMYGEVDDEALERLADIHWRAYREIRETIEAGKERLRKSGGSGTEVVSALFYIEAPLWGSIADDG